MSWGVVRIDVYYGTRENNRAKGDPVRIAEKREYGYSTFVDPYGDGSEEFDYAAVEAKLGKGRGRRPGYNRTISVANMAPDRIEVADLPVLIPEPAYCLPVPLEYPWKVRDKAKALAAKEQSSWL